MPRGSLPFRMFLLCVATVCGPLLVACISAPPPTPSFLPTVPPKGLPLASSDTVAFLVSSEIAPREAGETANVETSPISHEASVAQGFKKGFAEVLPNAQLVEADAALRAACFDVGTKSVTPSGVLLTIPNPRDAGCRALVEARRIAYLVPIGGQRKTVTVNTSTAVLLALGGTISVRHDHDFQLAAHAIGSSGDSSECEEVYSQSAESRVGVGAGWVTYYVPIPYVTGIDESSYWTDAGIRVGRQIAWCFVSPNSQAGDVVILKRAWPRDESE
jgi:hypothetical protein